MLFSNVIRSENEIKIIKTFSFAKLEIFHYIKDVMTQIRHSSFIFIIPKNILRSTSDINLRNVIIKTSRLSHITLRFEPFTFLSV